MWTEFTGVFIASLMGSLHCAGMCGPLSVLIKNNKNPILSQFLYHLMRLFVYLLMTAFVYYLGTPLRMSDIGSGFILLILILWAVLQYMPFQIFSWSIPMKFQKMMRYQFENQNILSGAVLGLFTTLLPCLWLYGFVIAAVAQKKLSLALLQMVVFWLGTIPALLGVHTLIFKFPSLKKIPFKIISAIILIGFMGYQMNHRLMHHEHSCHGEE